MAEGTELGYATTGLSIGVVAGADGAHGGRLVAGVGLGGVFEVGVRSAWTVYADVTCVL